MRTHTLHKRDTKMQASVLKFPLKASAQGTCVFLTFRTVSEVFVVFKSLTIHSSFTRRLLLCMKSCLPRTLVFFALNICTRTAPEGEEVVGTVSLK